MRATAGRAELPLAGGQAGGTVRVHPLLTGEILAHEAIAWALPRDRYIQAPA